MGNQPCSQGSLLLTTLHHHSYHPMKGHPRQYWNWIPCCVFGISGTGVQTPCQLKFWILVVSGVPDFLS